MLFCYLDWIDKKRQQEQKEKLKNLIESKIFAKRI